MKGALVSATSLAALLALEVGIGLALDAPVAMAQSLWASPGSINFGYMLLNTDGATPATVAQSVTNVSTQTTTVTIPSRVSGSGPPLSGADSSAVRSEDDATASTTHMLPPTVAGASSANVIGRFRGQATSKVTVAGTTVAPVQHTIISAFGAARVGTSATIAAVTVPKAGTADPATASSTLGAAPLHASIGLASSSVFKGNARTFSLNDTNYDPGTSGTGKSTSSAIVTDAYPRVGDGATAVTAFINGAGGATNAARPTSFRIARSGVGPTYKGNIAGTVYTDSTDRGTNTITTGTISLADANVGAANAVPRTLPNIGQGVAAASLTKLTLESFAPTGPGAAGFSILGFSIGAVAAGARSITVMLDFRGSTAGSYDADLTLTSDDGAPSGGSGAVIMYAVDPTIPKPQE